jgi:hypothetical protein
LPRCCLGSNRRGRRARRPSRTPTGSPGPSYPQPAPRNCRPRASLRVARVTRLGLTGRPPSSYHPLGNHLPQPVTRVGPWLGERVPRLEHAPTAGPGSRPTPGRFVPTQRQVVLRSWPLQGTEVPGTGEQPLIAHESVCPPFPDETWTQKKARRYCQAGDIVNALPHGTIAFAVQPDCLPRGQDSWPCSRSPGTASRRIFEPDEL